MGDRYPAPRTGNKVPGGKKSCQGVPFGALGIPRKVGGPGWPQGTNKGINYCPGQALGQRGVNMGPKNAKKVKGGGVLL